MKHYFLYTFVFLVVSVSSIYAQPPQKPYLQIGHNTAVYTTTFSNNGRFIASGSWKKVVLWDKKSAKILHTMYHKDNGHVWSLTFSSDDKRLISASRKGHIIIWDVQSGKAIKRFLAHDYTLLSISLSKDDRYLLSTSKKGAKVWDFDSLKPVQSFALHENDVIDSALYQTKNKYKAITMDEENLYIWNALTGEAEQKIFLDRELKSFALDKGKNRLVLATKRWSGGIKNSFYLYKTGSDKPIRILDTGKDDYKKVVFLDENHIAGLAHWEGKDRVDVFNLEGKKTDTYISPTQEMHTSLSVDTHRKELLIGDDSGAIFAMQDMKLKRRYDDNISFINDMTITDDGKWLVFATYSGKVYMYNFFSKAHKTFKKHTSNTYRVTTNNTGLVASRDTDGNIFIYDLYYFKNGFKGKILSDMSLAMHFLQEDQNFHLDLGNLANTDFEAMRELKETLVLSAGKDTYVWGMQEFKAKQIIKNKKQIRAIDSTNKGNILVTADKAKQIKLYYRKKDKFT
ncbi:MAG: WD40 repeat domain-containing protein, partial [Campylobacterota bacterium]